LSRGRRVARGEDLGDKSPPLDKKFFNFLEFLEKKIQKIFWSIFFFFFSYKKFKNPPIEKFLATPLSRGFIPPVPPPGNAPSSRVFNLSREVLDCFHNSKCKMLFSRG